MPRKIASPYVYLRVSSEDQNFDSQIEAIETWASKQKTPPIVLKEKLSGSIDARPEFQHLIEQIEAGNVSTVCVTRLDRLGRSVGALVRFLELLDRHKVNFVSLHEGFDLNTPIGRLTWNILASLAQFDNEVRAARIREGMAAAKAQGKRVGGGAKGRRTSKTRPEVVEAARSLRDAGQKISAIARTLNLSRPTIYSILGVDEAANESATN